MQTLGQLRAWCISMIEDEEINDDLDIWINNAVRQVEKHPFHRLRVPDLSMTTDADGVVAIPAWIRAPRRIASGDSVPLDYEFNLVEELPLLTETRFYSPYYTPYGMPTSEVVELTVDVVQGSRTVTNNGTSPWISASSVGQGGVFVGILRGEDSDIPWDAGEYEILAVDATTMTVFPDFRGPTSTAVTFRILEPNRFQLRNQDSTTFANKSIRVSAQRFHPRLYADDDIIMFEAEQVLRLTILKELLRNGKYDRDAFLLDRELEEAKLVELSPDIHLPHRSIPQGLGGGKHPFRRGSGRR